MNCILPETGTFVGRVWRPEYQGPSVVIRRNQRLFDITSPVLPTMQALLEHDDPAAIALAADRQDIGAFDDIADNSTESPDPARPWLLAPPDFQPIKANGVTFVSSMLERVIEEQANGDPAKAEALRDRCTQILGPSLRAIEPGSEKAAELKNALISEGVWSQYLEVGRTRRRGVFKGTGPFRGWLGRQCRPAPNINMEQP